MWARRFPLSVGRGARACRWACVGRGERQGRPLHCRPAAGPRLPGHCGASRAEAIACALGSRMVRGFSGFATLKVKCCLLLCHSSAPAERSGPTRTVHGHGGSPAGRAFPPRGEIYPQFFPSVSECLPGAAYGHPRSPATLSAAPTVTEKGRTEAPGPDPCPGPPGVVGESRARRGASGRVRERREGRGRREVSEKSEFPRRVSEQRPRGTAPSRPRRAVGHAPSLRACLTRAPPGPPSDPRGPSSPGPGQLAAARGPHTACARVDVRARDGRCFTLLL